MNPRTEAIIMVCKGRHNFGDHLTPKQAVAAYMADHCGCPVEIYDDAMLESIFAKALFDFIDNADRPGDFLRDIDSIYREQHTYAESTNTAKRSYLDALAYAFRRVSVRKVDGTLINGFTEENTRKVYGPLREEG